MATTLNLRPILDRPQWEMCAMLPFTSAAGTHVISSTLPDQLQLVIHGTTTQWLYDPATDAWLLLPSGALAGTFGAGTCGTHHPNGPTGTASAGSASTITTVTAVARSLAGYRVRITAGTGAGQERTIASNTVGTNAVLTVTTSWTVTPDATSQYLLLTGRFFVFIGGPGGPGMKYFDLATGTWSAALTMTGAPVAPVTDCKLRSTPGSVAQFATGTATAGTASTLTNGAKTWTVNQWTNSQVRITAGTGAGQIRTIASNTATVLTVAANWTINPDNTSVYAIECNDDYLYLAGNAAITLYRYSISGNSWSTLSPGVARSVAPGVGMSLNWVKGATAAAWTNEAAIINGRRLYSWRGAGTGGLDYYDIAANAWTNGVAVWGMGQETFTTGTVHDNADRGIIITQKDATGRFFALDVANQQLTPKATLFYPQSTAIVGDRLFTVEYTDGATRIQWAYFIGSTLTTMFRCLLI